MLWQKNYWLSELNLLNRQIPGLLNLLRSTGKETDTFLKAAENFYRWRNTHYDMGKYNLSIGSYSYCGNCL